MQTRVLTAARFETLLRFVDRGHPELSGYFDAERLFTRWMVDGEGSLSRPWRFSRVAFDFHGPEGVVGDEHEVASVTYAREADAWRWMASGPSGVRSGFCKGQRDAFPEEALVLSSAHLMGYQAHSRFYMGNISEKKRLVPTVLPLRVGPKTALLPWTSYVSAEGSRRDTFEVFFRCLIDLTPPRLSPFYGEGRVGSRRAFSLTHRVGSKMGARVSRGQTKQDTGWSWHVEIRAGVSKSGPCRSRLDGFKKVSSALKAMGFDTIFIPEDVAHVRGELGLSC